MYHQVAADAPAGYAHYTVTPTAFARQMRTLAFLGHRAISLDDLLAARAAAVPLPKRSVIITFDDGYADAIEHAVPVLLRHGFTATFFVVAGLLGRTSEWTRARRAIEMPLIDTSRLRELAGSGFTIGSHALTHPRLTDLHPTESRFELRESKRRLEDVLGSEVRHLAYPYGAVNELVRQAAAQCGYESACSIEKGLASLDDDALMLRRVHIGGSDSLATFVCRLRTGFPIRNVVQRARATMKVSALPR